MTNEILQKIKSIKLCLMAHPDNEENSEFAIIISDLEEIEKELSIDHPINWDDVYEEANHRSPLSFDEYVKGIFNESDLPKEKPTMEKYGYHSQDSFDDESSGWMIEGGEEAYYEALKKWEDASATKKITTILQQIIYETRRI